MDNQSSEVQAQHGTPGEAQAIPCGRGSSRLKITSNAKRASGASTANKPKRVRPKDSERRPASKAKICNVRMSFEEAAQLRQIAAASGEKSLQDFMYQKVRQIIEGAGYSAAGT